MKYKNIRKDLSAAISGYADNEIAQELVSKYKLHEGIMADEFFVSPIGRAVVLSAKRNDGVKNYLTPKCSLMKQLRQLET